ncbi:ABC transporter ATP-binding protein [Longirhabdus pacifica]|uniref:ABC transporter ATP-binding protein n=1 Tax=Longirhabdus pacifica TaxID=2305227 RepID=UPI00100927A8|nr:ABC transporter ATP-binding protein [Longirhabdus pacifica]
MDVLMQDVSKSYGTQVVLESMNMHFPSGQFTSLLGPSGCGKTTLLRLIAGLETPDYGDIYFAEHCMFSTKRKINRPVHQRKLGMVFQEFALWPHLTVFENVAFGLRATKDTKNLAARVEEAIKAVRLEGLEKRHPHQLSGGQQQRVAFARAIAIKPKLILFDEPLSALDAMLREEMRREILELVRNFGLTAVYVTHDQEEAMSMSDNIMVMQQGKLLQHGSPESIYSKPEDAFVANFVGKSNWIVHDMQMVRPEHVHFTSNHAGDRSWKAVVSNVSYQGERYEITLHIADGMTWTTYYNRRMQIGENVNVFVSPQHIQFFNHDKEEVLL